MSKLAAIPHKSFNMSAGGDDPFTSPTPNTAHHTAHQNELLASSDASLNLSSAAPAQARRILEARITDTDQRIQAASHLGTKLLDQRKQILERLQDIERHHRDDTISLDLQQKLSVLEQEWTQIGQETMRASIPRSRHVSGINDANNIPSILGGDARFSPAKLSVPTKDERNLSVNRTHDIELATEISTSLLAQVRNLQAAVAEKEDALRKANDDNVRLQSNSDVLQARLRSLDHDEERFKDENWNLETQVQDLSAQVRDTLTREEKLKQAINAISAEKVSAQREFEDIKQSHDRLSDDHAALQKYHDTELNGLRHAISLHENTRLTMQKHIDELTAQNQELARAVSYRIQSDSADGANGSHAKDLNQDDQVTPENSPPPSPTKATPRHVGLEHETLKSSLTHAHRMIQNLKNNIHREKTEKLELKRMLQDTRDELEARQNNSGPVVSGPRRGKQAGDFKKPIHPTKLGGRKQTSEEIWEDYEPSLKRSSLSRLDSSRQSERSVETSDTYATATENSEAYATASDKETATETDAFATAESVAGAESDELTETEDGPSRSRNAVVSIEKRPQTANRTSFLSSASDEEHTRIEMTPPSVQQRYRLRLTRGADRASESPSVRDSPASFMSNNSQRISTVNLATELGDFVDDESVGTNTPSRSLVSRQVSPELARFSASRQATPGVQAHPVSAPSGVNSKPGMKEIGTMTEPEWQHNFEQLSVATSVSAGAVSGNVLRNPEGVVFGNSEQGSGQTIKHAQIAIGGPTTEESFDSRESDPKVQLYEPGPVANARLQHLELSAIEAQQTLPVTSAVPHGTMSPAKARPAFGPIANESRQRNTGADLKICEPFTVSIEGRDIRQRKQKATEHASRTRAAGSPGPAILEDPDVISKVGIGNTETQEPALQLHDPTQDVIGPNRTPFRAVSGNTPDRRHQSTEKATDTKYMRTSINTNDEGSQTSLSAEQIDNLMKDRTRAATFVSPSPTGSPRSGGTRFSSSGRGSLIDAGLALRSSGSASSLRQDPSEMPPLPQDAKETIAAASRPNSAHRIASTSASVPNPVSSQQVQQPLRPRTPSITNRSAGNSSSPLKATSIHARTPTVTQNSHRDQQRRDSVSSFASELDERFNPNSQVYTQGYDVPGTDPRMIAAITQTMIGEFLWKYTRKPGRGELSENRHRRFFWIHPYTRTLYWSSQDPGAAGRAELKAKSVPIEAVRVITDENIVPPGLHSKSIVVVTPGRNIKFTAPTNYRHETWFNALSYLLLRGSGDQRQEVHQAPNVGPMHERTDTIGSIESGDVGDFELSRRTSSRMTAHSHRTTNSLSKSTRIIHAPNFSYRAPSPQGAHPAHGYYNRPAQAQSAAVPTSGSNRASAMQIQNAGGSSAGPRDFRGDGRGHGGETGEFKKPALPRASVTTQSLQGIARKPSLSNSATGSPSKNSSFASKVSSSLNSISRRGRQESRALDEERRKEAAMEQEMEQSSNQHYQHASGFRSPQHTPRKVENVRACCDGKHDVGHLHHRSTSRAASIASAGRRSLSLMGSRTHLGEGEY